MKLTLTLLSISMFLINIDELIYIFWRKEIKTANDITEKLEEEVYKLTPKMDIEKFSNYASLVISLLFYMFSVLYAYNTITVLSYFIFMVCNSTIVYVSMNGSLNIENTFYVRAYKLVQLSYVVYIFYELLSK